MGGSEIVQGNTLVADRYEVIRVLGAGNSSRVCLVHDCETDRDVALKLLVNRAAFDESTLARFVREFEICKSIRHPNIVEAYDLVEHRDSLAFTVEYVDGEDLAKIIDERQLTHPEIDLIFTHLLSALEELHSRKIIHRDIKPENLILRSDHVLKVADLGLWKRLDQPGLTRPGVVLGTAQYMPPEYIRDGIHDERGDIYAAGMVLYELLTGKRRLRSKRATEVFELLDKTEFELPPLALSGLPKRYVTIIKKALSVNPDDRFQTAAEMLKAFETAERSAVIIDQDTLAPRIELGTIAPVKTRILPPRRILMARVVLLAGVFSVMALVAALSWPRLKVFLHGPQTNETPTNEPQVTRAQTDDQPRQTRETSKQKINPRLAPARLSGSRG